MSAPAAEIPFHALDLSDLDPETRQVVCQVHLEDLQALQRDHPGQDDPDTRIAIELYKKELRDILVSAADHRMCRSIATAVMTDGGILQELKATPKPTMSDEEIRTLAARYVWVLPSIHEIFNLRSFAQWATEQQAVFRHVSQCACCAENVKFYDMSKCPCGHEYCRACLTELFRASCNDESLFPPRCCKQAIPVDRIVLFLGSKLVAMFRAKTIEFGTKDRTYCHVPTCSVFIPPSSIKNKVGTCVTCANKTCVSCKHRAHQGDCAQDPASEQLIQLARENGWQRCRECHRMVELTLGCNHMTCHCGSHFCYVCGEKWKTCACPVWDEARLLARAQQLADRHQAQPLPPAQRAVLVQAERQNLVENHECDHERWRSLQGRHRCEECDEVMPYFAYECRQCQIVACRRCRYHRL